MLSFFAKHLCVGILISVLIGCADHSFEHKFFQQSFATAEARMTGYSLEDQYKIFRYGNDVVHPPMMELANPIAKLGGAAVPFLLMKLASETDDVGIRDIALIFQEMTLQDYYDVRSDKVVMSRLTQKVESMTTWKDVTLGMIDEIKQSDH